MSSEPPPLPAVPAPPVFDADKIFFVLGNAERRQMLRILSKGEKKAACHLAPVVGLRLDATLKHLSEMRKAGLLEMTPDREDERRRLYHLHPAVKILTTETGREMDFGCAVMRW